jgi:hypothetical protein
MKYILLFMLTTSVHAGQGKMLSIARDSYLTSSISRLTEYCESARPDLPNDKNYLYVCHLQAQADCSHGEDDIKKDACNAIKRVKSLEKMVIVSDRNLSLVEKIPVGINLSTPKEYDRHKAPDLPVVGQWIKTSIPNIQSMSEEEWIIRGRPNKKAFQETANEWKLAMDKVNSQKVILDCKADSECKLEFYGSFGCANGHEGFFAMSLLTQSPELLSSLANYNQIQAKAYKELKESAACMAVMRDFNPKCQENKCTGVTTY